jgi:DNA-binding transcriptional ArsR family regulator
MEESITLDRKAFKVLASDTRVDILKHLGKRRMTLTELSKRLGMSASSVKEHMDGLASAGLVVQKDDGHKWKYYELTGKGRGILSPVDKRVYFILGISVILMLGGFYAMFVHGWGQAFLAGGASPPGFAPLASTAAGAGDMRAAENAQDAIQAPEMAGEEAGEAAGAGRRPEPAPYAWLAVVAAGLLVAGMCIGYLVTKRGMACL